MAEGSTRRCSAAGTAAACAQPAQPSASACQPQAPTPAPARPSPALGPRPCLHPPAKALSSASRMLRVMGRPAPSISSLNATARASSPPRPQALMTALYAGLCGGVRQVVAQGGEGVRQRVGSSRRRRRRLAWRIGLHGAGEERAWCEARHARPAARPAASSPRKRTERRPACALSCTKRGLHWGGGEGVG